MSCNYCSDEDGICVYPIYGVGPHTCFYKIPGATIGESVGLDRSDWPSNFIEDPEAPQVGTSPANGIWTHCLKCGDGEPDYKIKEEDIIL